MQLLEDAVVVGPGDALRVADDHLDVGLERALEHLVHLAVVVVVVPDAEHALDVVPDGGAEARRVHVPLRAHEVVRERVHEPELLVEQVADVVVQPVEQRERVVVPRVVLHAERRDQARLPAPGKVLVQRAIS